MDDLATGTSQTSETGQVRWAIDFWPSISVRERQPLLSLQVSSTRARYSTTAASSVGAQGALDSSDPEALTTSGTGSTRWVTIFQLLTSARVKRPSLSLRATFSLARSSMMAASSVGVRTILDSLASAPRTRSPTAETLQVRWATISPPCSLMRLRRHHLPHLHQCHRRRAHLPRHHRPRRHPHRRLRRHFHRRPQRRHRRHLRLRPHRRHRRRP
mmetsp:Transcript_3797/g.8283  ORF Transcript_3797/g.8283 Transcript_3797/m.8283 type:complete len:215 (-) Transcript_3797:58-702(-)